MHTVKIVGQSATKGELPIRTDDDGNLIIQLEGATVNVGDVDVASIAAGTSLIGKVGIDQVTANANEVVIKSRTAETYLGKDRTTTTGAAEELTIPAGSKRVVLSCGPSGQAYIELNADATTSSPLYFEAASGPITLDLGSVTKLSAYVVAGNLGAVFFG